MSEATVLTASVLPTTANTDHTFTFRATLSLDSTMLAGGQAVTASYGDGSSDSGTTSTNGIAIFAHKCACEQTPSAASTPAHQGEEWTDAHASTCLQSTVG